MNPSNRELSKNSSPARRLTLGILFLGLLVKFVPFNPAMPGGGPDPSWTLATNEAVARHFLFGTQIIFTSGPFSSVYTHLFHPATFFMVFVTSLYLAIACWACLVVLTRNAGWGRVLGLSVGLLGLLGPGDVEFYVFSLAFALATIRALDDDAPSWLATGRGALLIALIAAPFGLLPLIKISLIPLSAFMTIASAAVLALCGFRMAGIAAVIGPVVALPLCWIWAGQPISGLGSYFASMPQITLGYTTAMSQNPQIPATVSHITLKLIWSYLTMVGYLIAAAMILVVLLVHRRRMQLVRILLGGIYFTYLFFAFKAGFVRHDSHVLIAGEALLFGALLLPFVVRSRLADVALAVAVCVYLMPEIQHAHIHLANPAASYVSAASGIAKTVTQSNWMHADYDAALQSLRRRVPLPQTSTSTDIYPTDQSYLIASGSNWNPRPLLQSYSAYTPMLAEKDRQHLASSTAPENIVFAVQPIDGRLPSLEDGPSWPTIIRNYFVTGMQDGFLLLSRKAHGPSSSELQELSIESHRMGQEVLVPDSPRLVFVRVDLDPTFLGKLADFAYKPPEIFIRLTLTDGTRRQYRFIPGMGQAGFVLSPLVEETDEFLLLAEGNIQLIEKRVKTFSIGGKSGVPVSVETFWSKNFQVTFSSVNDAPIAADGTPEKNSRK